jgi:hypothetical protein
VVTGVSQTCQIAQAAGRISGHPRLTPCHRPAPVLAQLALEVVDRRLELVVEGRRTADLARSSERRSEPRAELRERHPVALDRLGRTGYYDLCMRDTDVADVWRHMFQSCPDAPEYVSRQLDCARSRASEQGVADIREIDADGEGILRSDRKSGRLNLFVRDGVVVAAAWC